MKQKIESVFPNSIELLRRCERSYHNCINSDENIELREEIGVSLDELELAKESIRIEFDSAEYGELIFDTKFKILNLNTKESIGYYRCIENLEGDFVDDFLVFH